MSVAPVASCQRAAPFGDRELDDDAEDERPHQREPVLGAGDGGRHHVADADAGGRQQQSRAEVGELHGAAIMLRRRRGPGFAALRQRESDDRATSRRA